MMPVEGPTPLIKPTVDLWTTNMEEYFSKVERSGPSYNTFILGLAERGLVAEAKRALDSMKVQLKFSISCRIIADPDDPQRHGLRADVRHWTSLMKACVGLKDPDHALELLNLMLAANIKPTAWTIDVILEACVAAGQLDRAYELYDLLKTNELVPDVGIFTTLIKGCLDIDKDYKRAWDTWYHMRTYHCEPDVVLFTLMIHICAKQGEVERALSLFDEMKTLGIRPTDLTFNGLIYACSRRLDYYDETFRVLEQMKADGFTPGIVTLVNVLNACAKSGDVPTASLFVAAAFLHLSETSFTLFCPLQNVR